MAAPYNPPVKNEDFVIRISLANAAVNGSFKANPTIAAGDFKVDKDGGGLTNLTTLPSVEPAGSVLVKISLSATEMNADVVSIVGIDQTATKEWADFVLCIPTTAYMAVFRLFLGSGGAPLNTGVLLAQNAIVTGTGTVADTPKVYLRPDGDVALDGWTDQADGTSNIYQVLDETSASDSDYVQSPEVAAVEEEDRTITIGTTPNFGISVGYSSFIKAAQTFISNGTSISSITLWLRKINAPSFGIHIKIFTVDASHFPVTQVGVTSSAVAAASLTETSQPFDLIFSPSIVVANGAEYSFVVERDDGSTDTSNFIHAGGDSGNPYASGQLLGYNGTAWAAVSAWDIVSVIDQIDHFLKVRLFDGSTQIVEWEHTDIADTFTDAVQTLTTPQFEAISSFANLFAEFDDNQGNVYRFALGDPASEFVEPVKIRYRYKKLAA